MNTNPYRPADAMSTQSEQEKRRVLATLDQQRRKTPQSGSKQVAKADNEKALSPLELLQDMSRTAPSYAFSRALQAGLEAFGAVDASSSKETQELVELLQRILACQVQILNNGNLADELNAARATIELLEKNTQSLESKLLDTMADVGNRRRDVDEMENALFATQRHAADAIRQRDELAQKMGRLRREHQETKRAHAAAEEELLRISDAAEFHKRGDSPAA